MLREPFFETLPCRLTEAEVDERGREGAERAVKLKAFKEKAAAKKKKLTADEKDLTKQVFDLGQIVMTKVEDRKVVCYEHANKARYTVEIIRMDSGEIVRTRPMSEEERKQADQGTLIDFAEQDQAEREQIRARMDREREAREREHRATASERLPVVEDDDDLPPH